MIYNKNKFFMESKKHNHDNVHKKNTLVLPKSYIGQEPVKIKHKRYNSLTDDILNKELSSQNSGLEENDVVYRFNTDRKPKKVSFNKRIQVINIRNYKKENRILYYGEDAENDEDNHNIKKENKCLTCFIF